MNIRRQKGVALIAAMLVLVIGVTIATNLLWSANLQLHRTKNLNYMDRARLYALGGEAWVADVLLQDLEETEADSLDETWAVALPPLPVEEAQITGELIDEQSKFNVNNLVDEAGQKDLLWYGVFVRLLTTLELDPTLADKVVDWLDPDIDVSFPDGAEDDAYTGLELPYRSANLYISDVSELRAIQGIDAQVWETLKPHVTALPRGTLVNINTAGEIVLASLSDDVSVFDAQIITENRIGEPYTSVEQAASFLPADALALASVSTEYFLLNSIVALGTAQFSMYSLLERNAQQASVTARWRHHGHL